MFVRLCRIGLIAILSFMERFCRVEQLLGTPALERLQKSRVAVFGLGAVGSYAVEALARVGIGALRLVDCDVIRISNFNRQLYALESTLHRPKTDVARERVLEINPHCVVDTKNVFVDHTNVQELLDGGWDVVVDAIDSLTPKVTLLAAAVQAGIPVVSSMGAATRRDPQYIRLADISATRYCPLARFVRKKLRQRGVTSGVWCVYSEEPAWRPPAHEAQNVETEAFERGRPRRTLGSLPFITGVFGLWTAWQACNLLVQS